MFVGVRCPATCWPHIAMTCVLVPIRTENLLRFSAQLDDGVSEVRSERAIRT